MSEAEDQQGKIENMTKVSQFTWPDYCVFSTMLAMSAVIGIYSGCFLQRKQKTTKEYLLANQKMGVVPTAFSLTASFMSAIILLGTPREMYTYGTMYWDLIGGYFLAMASAAYLFSPIFFEMRVISAFEYLEKRFSRPVRILASLLGIIQMCIYTSLAVYTPSIALEQVTGVHVYVTVATMFFICIFYTTLGGMHAVMYTDMLQVFIMVISMLVIVIKGVADAGGHSVVWANAVNGSRIEFLNYNADPRERHTVWGLVIGGYFTWIALYTNQSQIQRYLSVPTLKEAQWAIWINFVGLSGILSLCCYAGLVLYSKYKDCDPVLSGKVQRADQMFVLFVMETVGNFPGLPGLFVSGVFSGALSTVSSAINALSAVALEDYAKAMHPTMSEKTATIISKLFSIIFGLISFGLVFIAAQMGSVLQAANSIFGMIGGPLLGTFTLGIFFPWATNKGAIIGTVTSFVLMFWLGISTNIASINGQLVTRKLPVSTESCPVSVSNMTMIGDEAMNFNSSRIPAEQTDGDILLEMYRISYIWYSTIGSLTVVIVGLIASFVFGPQDSRLLNPNLISSPVNNLVNRFFSESFRRKINWQVGTLFHEGEARGEMQLNFQALKLLKGDLKHKL